MAGVHRNSRLEPVAFGAVLKGPAKQGARRHSEALPERVLDETGVGATLPRSPMRLAPEQKFRVFKQIFGANRQISHVGGSETKKRSGGVAPSLRCGFPDSQKK